MDSTLITLISVSNVALVRGSRKSQLQEGSVTRLDSVCKVKSLLSHFLSLARVEPRDDDLLFLVSEGSSKRIICKGAFLFLPPLFLLSLLPL